jgi:hypothetical protein
MSLRADWYSFDIQPQFRLAGPEVQIAGAGAGPQSDLGAELGQGWRRS